MKKLLYLAILLGLFSCKQEPKIHLMDAKAFEKTIDGKEIKLYTLKAGNITAQVTNFGGRIVSLWVPDKNDKYEDVVLGYENIDRYLDNKGERFLGAVVGRYANRIANGKFTLDGIDYQVPVNNNGQSLHGGNKGFDMVIWNVDKVTDNQIDMSYTSADGEEGYPGNLTVYMAYTLTPDNELKITYKATTDKPTVVNLSHHSFFNLKGEGNGTILDHVLTINASNTSPIDSVLIPSGEILSVEGTPFDFRTSTAIGERINQDNVQLKNGLGYDHNWIADRKSVSDIEHIATLEEPISGRIMEVWSDQPAIQFYSGNFFDGKTIGKYGKAQNFRESVALETQKYPDSPNHANFPSTRLNPDETYTQTCIYKFSSK